jgi:ferredoxin
MSYRIEFPDTKYDPIELRLGANLSENLTILNSPMLFGCRTGVCGTCLVQIEKGCESLRPPEPEESEALAVYAPCNPRARLACQIFLDSDIALKKIESA